jgi:hypothetical protein
MWIMQKPKNITLNHFFIFMSSKMKSMKPNDSGKKYLVEQAKKICVNHLLRKIKDDAKLKALENEIQLDGYEIKIKPSITGFGGKRYWFSCPICGSRVGIIFKHPISSLIGCRKCLGLEYRCRRFKGMIENDINKS